MRTARNNIAGRLGHVEDYSAAEIRSAQEQLDLQRHDSPWWDTPTGQDQARLIKDCGLKRNSGS